MSVFHHAASGVALALAALFVFQLCAPARALAAIAGCGRQSRTAALRVEDKCTKSHVRGSDRRGPAVRAEGRARA
jgi:hypothetical protein